RGGSWLHRPRRARNPRRLLTGRPRWPRRSARMQVTQAGAATRHHPRRRRALRKHGPASDRTVGHRPRLGRLRVLPGRDAPVRQPRQPRPRMVRRDRSRSDPRRAHHPRLHPRLRGARRRPPAHREAPRPRRHRDLGAPMDITETLAPRSDQINADDLVAAPRTGTVTEVRRGSTEQPVEVVTQEFGPGRPYKPGKSMRRVLAKVWGTEASAWVGGRLTLYCDPDITFGREKVGGIRISHMSGLDKPATMLL